MGFIHKMTKQVSNEKWKRLDARIRREDEDRWLSSRYARPKERMALLALYAFNLELARVRVAVSEMGLGAIRFQWWREVVAEIEAGKPARKHDVVEAIIETNLPTRTLSGLIDGHAAAFDEQDRSLEPETLLMRTAVSLLTGPHAWGEHIAILAPAFAATRRGETAETGPVFPKAPEQIRAAVCHSVLRFDYARGKKPGGLAKRITIMRAMLFGRV